jgi:hypothetical protein
MKFTKEDIRTIRLALSHYAYAPQHDPEQLYTDL